MTVLITDVRYRMAAALIRALGERGYRVIVCDDCDNGTESVPPCFFSKYVSRAVKLSANYNLMKLCRDLALENNKNKKIILLPVGASTIAKVSANENEFAQYCHLCVPSPASLETANNKASVAQIAGELGIPIPCDYSEVAEVLLFGRSGSVVRDCGLVRKSAVNDSGQNNIKYPCVVKPACGEKFGLTARDRYAIVRNEGELRVAYEKFARYGRPVVQEYIGGYGAGVGVTIDRHGGAASVICHRRIREYPVGGGPSSCCESILNLEIARSAIKLLQHIGFRGIAMVEFRGDEKHGFKLLEINPRVWGSFPLTYAAGSDFAEKWVFAAAGKGSVPVGSSDDAASVCNYKTRVKMKFTFSELAAFAEYLRNGNPVKAAAAFAGALNPFTRDGVMTLSDLRFSVKYVMSVLRRRK